MKKIILSSIIALLASNVAFANVAPTERLVLNGFVQSPVKLDNYPAGTTPVTFNYDLGTPFVVAMQLDTSDGHNAQQFWCNMSVLTTKNSDGSYNTTVKNLNGNVKCTYTSTGTGSTFTPTFNWVG